MTETPNKISTMLAKLMTSPLERTDQAAVALRSAVGLSSFSAVRLFLSA